MTNDEIQMTEPSFPTRPPPPPTIHHSSFVIRHSSPAPPMTDYFIASSYLIASLLFIYGLKSVWIPWLWPVFNQIFMMIFLSVWLRRSGVMTGAEFIQFRFGNGNTCS